MRIGSLALANIAAALLLSMNIGCTGSSSSSDATTSTPLTISGGFASLSLAALQPDNGLYTPMAATDYTMVCSMLVDPFTSGSDALDSSGAFTLNISGAAGKPIGCFLTKSGAIAAVIEFTAASSGFSGAAGGSTYSPNSDSKTLTFPTNLSISNGVVSVDTTTVTEDGTTAVATSWTDPTGGWNITGACQNGFDKTTGTYKSECQSAASGGGNIPTSVYLNQVSATNGTLSKNGLAIWASAAARAGCGSVEGSVNLESGWSATGGWNSAFTGTGAFNLSGTAGVHSAATLATAIAFDGSTTVCNATVPTPGTSKCSDVAFTGMGTLWGMSDEACKLYCVVNAISNNRPDDGETTYNFGSATCPLRYRVNWQHSNELSNDSDYNPMNGAPTPGAFNGGFCASGTNKCATAADAKVFLEADDRGPSGRYMFGELFISGNVGTLVQKDHFTNNFQNAAQTGSITCGGTRVEKLTMVQESATTAVVTVENNFVPDLTNNTECATNTDFARFADEDSSFTLKMTKQ